MVIHVYHPYRQPDAHNYCLPMNGRCSHICLPAPQLTANSAKTSCTCPRGLKLDKDNLNCIHDREWLIIFFDCELSYLLLSFLPFFCLSMHVFLLFLIINNLCPKMKMNGFTFCFLFFCDCFYHRQRICCLDWFKIILELFWTWSKSKVGLSEYSTICWSSRLSDNGLFILKPYVNFFAIHEIWISRSKVSADYGKQNSNFVIAN